ncbi:MAG: hypothetical protein RL885_27045 [Planctomycetota bacterium]
MRVGTIRASELADGLRFTGGYHLSEDQESLRQLSVLRKSSVPVSSVVGPRGVFKGGLFRKIEAQSPEHGRPYVSAKDIERLVVRPSSRISTAHGRLLDELALHEGMTLVTCSGMNLGKAVFVRRDMSGLCASGDLIRVVADESRIRPGYLGAFLATRHARVAIRRQIYGGNIKHVDPSHVGSVLVPRFTDEQESRVNSLLMNSASKRSDAMDLIHNARSLATRELSLPTASSEGATDYCAFDVPSRLLSRLDAYHHSPRLQEASTALGQTADSRRLADVANVFTPGIFKRPHVDDPAHGYPYFSGSELFHLNPQPRGYLSRYAPGIREYVVESDWLLVQDAGQVGGLIGQIVRVGPQTNGGAVSNHLMRIVAESRLDAAYLFALLTCQLGYLAIVRNAFGSSIPQLDPVQVGNMSIPWPAESVRSSVADLILRAWDLQDSAAQMNLEAVALVEQLIEEAS